MWEVAGMMLNKSDKKHKKVIVITGSIGTGKSTAVNILKNLGYKVLDSDKIVHEGYNKDSELYKKVVERFGNEVLNEDKDIDRQSLGKIVFNDENSLKDLNKLAHVYVIAELMKGVNECSDRVIFLDIPLILENINEEKEYGLKYDEIWLVYVNAKTQKERLIERAIKENKKPEDVLKIIKIAMMTRIFNKAETASTCISGIRLWK